MKISTFFPVIYSLFLSLSSSLAFAENCQQIRMGIDIGSGSTKIMVAQVDTCQKKIVDVLLSESHPIQYSDDLAKNNNGKLSDSILEKGLATLQELVKKGNLFHPVIKSGVATGVFRKAQNGKEAILNFSKKLDFKIEVIDQNEEAMLGYFSVLLTVKPIKPLLVWDIGGGSMQLSYLNEKTKNMESYLGQMASISFKNKVIEVLQLNDINKMNSPNPIADKREEAIQLARAHASITVPLDFKKIISNSFLVGIGGIHNNSIKKQLALKESKYTLSQLSDTGKIQSAKNDQEIGGEYAATDVSNLLLVQGFMEELGINEVTIANASILQGVLLK